MSYSQIVKDTEVKTSQTQRTCTVSNDNITIQAKTLSSPQASLSLTSGISSNSVEEYTLSPTTSMTSLDTDVKLTCSQSSSLENLKIRQTKLPIENDKKQNLQRHQTPQPKNSLTPYRAPIPTESLKRKYPEENTNIIVMQRRKEAQAVENRKNGLMQYPAFNTNLVYRIKDKYNIWHISNKHDDTKVYIHGYNTHNGRYTIDHAFIKHYTTAVQPTMLEAITYNPEKDLNLIQIPVQPVSTTKQQTVQNTSLYNNLSEENQKLTAQTVELSQQLHDTQQTLTETRNKLAKVEKRYDIIKTDLKNLAISHQHAQSLIKREYQIRDKLEDLACNQQMTELQNQRTKWETKRQQTHDTATVSHGSWSSC